MAKRLKPIFLFALFFVLAHLPRVYSFSGNDGKGRGYIGICGGITSYYGDLGNNNSGEVPLMKKVGVQVQLEREIVKPVRVFGGLFLGNLVGDEISSHRNLNFKTSITSPYLGISVNLLSPFHGVTSKGFALWLSGGVEYFLFTPQGDVKDASGKPYYFWSDGSIRTQTEIPGHVNSATVIQRDYKYETDYRNLNIDNVSSYPKVAVGFPVGLSVEKKFSGRTSFRIGTIYHFTSTDYLDNITANSIGSRQGDSGNDRYLFVYAGLFYRIPFPFTRRCPAMK